MYRITNYLRTLKILLTSDIFIPLLFLFTYIIFFIFAKGVLPTAEELIGLFSALYQQFGYEIIFIAALLESLILVNIFIPGQIVMAMGVIFARSGQTDLVTVLIIASSGTILGYMIDYSLGLYGFSQVISKLGYGHFLDQTKTTLKKFGTQGMILSYIHTNIGTLSSFSAGTTKMPWVKFITLAAISTWFWSTFWGLLVYAVGDVILEIIKKYSFLLVIFIIAGLFLMKMTKKEKKVN